MKICLVIIYYNELKYLEKLFYSLTSQTNLPDNIIFIDNNSTENPSEIINKYKNKLNIEYINPKENLFFTRGMNIGIRRALEIGSEIIGCMNSDMWCDSNMIEEIKKYFLNNKDTIALTPNIRDLDNTKDVFYPVSPLEYFKSPIKYTKGIDSNTYFLIGASLFVRSNILLKTGLFYEPYIHGTEDFEMSNKLRKYGVMKYIYSTNIYHRDSTVPKKISLFFERLNSKNWYIYCLRNYKPGIFLNIVALFKNLFLYIAHKDIVAKERFLGKIEGFKETIFHLTNNNKYL